jgi:putative membrane protein
VAATAYCVVMQWFLTHRMWTEWIPDLPVAVEGLDAFGHVVLGSLIGFLLVMRMNASNSRYWEGRSHWGAIINASRNLARLGAAYTPEGKTISDLIAGYAITLKQSLRGSRDLSEADDFLPPHLKRATELFGNQPTAVAAEMSRWVNSQAKEGHIDPELTRFAEEQICKIVDAQGGCEKIQKTPLPFAYVALIKLLILVYMLTLPLVICGRFGWWSPLLMAVLSFGMFGMEETSVEIEDPFGDQPNCLDLDTLTITITRDTGQLAIFDEVATVGTQASSGESNS